MTNKLPEEGLTLELLELAASFAALGFRPKLTEVHLLSVSDMSVERSRKFWRIEPRVTIREEESGKKLGSHDALKLIRRLGRPPVSQMLTTSKLARKQPDHPILLALGACALRDAVIATIKESRPLNLRPVSPSGVRYVEGGLLEDDGATEGPRMRVAAKVAAPLVALAQLGFSPSLIDGNVTIPSWRERGGVRINAAKIASEWGEE